MVGASLRRHTLDATCRHRMTYAMDGLTITGTANKIFSTSRLAPVLSSELPGGTYTYPHWLNTRPMSDFKVVFPICQRE
jgi:hypothetical protein